MVLIHSYDECKWRAAVVFGNVFWYWGSTGGWSVPAAQSYWGYRELTAVWHQLYMLLYPALRLSASPLLSPSFLSTLSHGHGFQCCSLVSKKDNFVDHYCVITVISPNYFSIHASNWKDAHRASQISSRHETAGALLLTPTACTCPPVLVVCVCSWLPSSLL